MATKAELAALQRASEEAEAAQEIEALNGIRRDDVLDAETRGEAKRMGLGSAAVKATNDADRNILLYHAYDGREHPVPKYMAPRYVTTRFVRGDQEVPEQYWGKPVWSIDPGYPTEDDTPREFQCRLSSATTDPYISAEIKGAGLAATCRKKVRGGGFTNQFEADEHFRKKHPRRWAAYQRFLSRDSQNRGADAMTAAVQAMLALAAANTKE